MGVGLEAAYIHIACCVANVSARFFSKYANSEARPPPPAVPEMESLAFLECVRAAREISAPCTAGLALVAAGMCVQCPAGCMLTCSAGSAPPRAQPVAAGA